jgi:DNA-directed RNA polymerase subunit beta'
MNRHGELVVVDDTGREREHHRLVYGAVLKCAEGDKVKPGQLLAEWDAFANVILTEVGGIAKFGDIVEGVTMIEKLDEVTGLSRKVVIESRAADLRPRVSLKHPETGETLKLPNSTLEARYLLPVGANIVVQDGDLLEPGEIISKIPRETTKTQDITGGLPACRRALRGPQAEGPRHHREIDGEVSFGKDTKGKRKVVITPFSHDGQPLSDQSREYLIPKGKHIHVQPGDRVRAGEPLQDGPANPHDILRVKGEKELAAYLVNEIQQVYRLQGVAINDKHIEVIVRQMLRRVRIKDVGDTNFLVDENVEKHIFERENSARDRAWWTPGIAEPLLLGITKASLSTESFISRRPSRRPRRSSRSGDQRQDGHAARPQGERHHGTSHPGRHGLAAYKSLNLVVEGEAVESGYVPPVPQIPPPAPSALTAMNEE